MTKHSLDPSNRRDRPRPPAADGSTPRDGACDLYAPGHQIHYQHQGRAVRSPSEQLSIAILDGVLLTLVLQDGDELRWRHHDPVPQDQRWASAQGLEEQPSGP